MILRSRSHASHVGFGPYIPDVFSSLEEARNSLDYHSNRYFGFLRTVAGAQPPSEEEAERIRIRSQGLMNQWSTAFEKFLHKAGIDLDAKGQQGALVLKIYERMKDMHLKFPASYFFSNETIWDEHVSVGQEIVDLAEKVVALDENTSITDKPIFSFDLNIISPLYSVAHKCRDPYVRRRAIALLRSSPRQEGIWNSTMAAHVAERIMTIEESGLGEVKSSKDVPDWARISDVVASFDPIEKKASFSYSRQRSKLVFVREMFSETLSW